MAYTCVLAPSRECDGCMECEEKEYQYDNEDKWDYEYDNYRDEMMMKGDD